MRSVYLHSKQEIEQFLRRNTFLHLLSIGDLDDAFWQYTTWYALKEQEQISQVALLYTGISVPAFLAVSEPPTAAMRELLQSIVDLLPRRFYAHLTADVVDALANDYRMEHRGTHHKMALLHTAYLDTVDTSNVVALAPSDAPALEALYSSYPENHFEPHMLETGYYYGIRHGADIVSVAGIHVYSPRYKVAVLGNVMTHPDHRRRGLSTAVCARLCRELLRTVDHIGLNVKADNAAAIACYERLGFVHNATFEAYICERKLS